MIVHNSSYFNFLKQMLSYFLKPINIHVRMSERGKNMMNDHRLASKVVETILDNKQELQNGDSVDVKGENIKIEILSSVDESMQTENK